MTDDVATTAHPANPPGGDSAEVGCGQPAVSAPQMVITNRADRDARLTAIGKVVAKTVIINGGGAGSTDSEQPSSPNAAAPRSAGPASDQKWRGWSLLPGVLGVLVVVGTILLRSGSTSSGSDTVADGMRTPETVASPDFNACVGSFPDRAFCEPGSLHGDNPACDLKAPRSDEYPVDRIDAQGTVAYRARKREPGGKEVKEARCTCSLNDEIRHKCLKHLERPYLAVPMNGE